jgi:hypothetical protein
MTSASAYNRTVEQVNTCRERIMKCEESMIEGTSGGKKGLDCFKAEKL